MDKTNCHGLLWGTESEQWSNNPHVLVGHNLCTRQMNQTSERRIQVASFGQVFLILQYSMMRIITDTIGRIVLLCGPALSYGIRSLQHQTKESCHVTYLVLSCLVLYRVVSCRVVQYPQVQRNHSATAKALTNPHHLSAN